MRNSLFRAEVVAVASICVAALLIVIVPMDADSGETHAASPQATEARVAQRSATGAPRAPMPARVWPPPPAPAAERVDEIRVDKSDRRMRLLRDGREIRNYRILLGDAPVGHKRQQGDERTPEGRYTISGRNPRSRFHLSLRVSYPDAADRAQARARGVDPGGDIMIHGGTPVGYNRDWTDGCIAVTNAEIEEIWRLVPNGIPIVIVP